MENKKLINITILHSTNIYYYEKYKHNVKKLYLGVTKN